MSKWCNAPILRASALAAFALALAPMAGAQPRQTSIAGHWNFDTVIATERQCVITGDAILTPTDSRGAYSVRMTTFERCRDGSTWRSVQSCIAQQSGAAVRLECEIVSVEPDNYAPDNFTLQIRNPDLMEGALVSTWSARAVWRRAEPALIS